MNEGGVLESSDEEISQTLDLDEDSESFSSLEDTSEIQSNNQESSESQSSPVEPGDIYNPESSQEVLDSEDYKMESSDYEVVSTTQPIHRSTQPKENLSNEDLNDDFKNPDSHMVSDEELAKFFPTGSDLKKFKETKGNVLGDAFDDNNSILLPEGNSNNFKSPSIDPDLDEELTFGMKQVKVNQNTAFVSSMLEDSTFVFLRSVVPLKYHPGSGKFCPLASAQLDCVSLYQDLGCFYSRSGSARWSYLDTNCLLRSALSFYS